MSDTASIMSNVGPDIRMLRDGELDAITGGSPYLPAVAGTIQFAVGLRVAIGELVDWLAS